MTILEAIMDSKRPLSVTPEQWVEMSMENNQNAVDLAESEVEIEIEEENGSSEENSVVYDDFERLDIGIEKMVSGFRIASMISDKIDRSDLNPEERKMISEIRKFLFHGVAPYLSDLISARSRSYGGE